MPFREKLKKAFKTGSPASSKTTSPVIEQDSRWPSNVYKPGEPMPRLKYRAPVKKEHQDKLDSFSFGKAWRRRSQQSLYSPMGSRLPSRKGSLARRPSHSSKRPSFSGRSRKSVSGVSSAGASAVDGGSTRMNMVLAQHEEDMGSVETSKDASRNNSVAGSEKRFKDAHGAARPTRLSTEVEHEGDDDVGNGRSLRRKQSVVAFVLPDYTGTYTRAQKVVPLPS